MRFIPLQHLQQRDNFCLHHLPLASSHFSLLFNSPSEYYISLRCQIECSVIPYKTKGSIVHATMTYDLKSIPSAIPSRKYSVTISSFRGYRSSSQFKTYNAVRCREIGVVISHHCYGTVSSQSTPIPHLRLLLLRSIVCIN